MSRSRKSKAPSYSRPDIIFGQGFPIGRSVCGCFLKKVSVVDKFWGDVLYHQVQFNYLHESSGKWLTKFVSDYPLEKYDTKEQHDVNKINVAQALENVMACYLTGHHIKHLMFQTKLSGLRNLMEDVTEALQTKKFWATEVCLKTLPNDEGGVGIAMFAPFVNKTKGSSWILKYNNWEQEKIQQFTPKNN